MRDTEKGNDSCRLRVIEDIISGKGKAYALKGDQVTLVAEYGEVLIVVKNGERFPVMSSKVQKLI